MFSDRIYLELDRQDIAYFKFILEGWDNIAYFTVIDKYRAVIQLVCSKDDYNRLMTILDVLKNELYLNILYIKKEYNYE
ncbi:MAG: DUF4911 domain-containing protein [Desulfonauticus sp.]|nr:DUF4911 domain-containing protein [Desulfonauticus sp.]